ncbi:NAD(FAD)-utilizing dehydrogenases [hydrothermal vent metagenome]|uniref:NAD(FAD)-utilizing dehydrogenases n=1 Tax=hydrothermal vent metagenome TaxID=652676 RepID=A0A1W1D4G1_9ZZZZ
MYDVIILGAGASGLMCATHLHPSHKIAIVEHNEKMAKKLKISGGGKCNITNVFVSENNYDGDKILLEYILSAFSKEDLLDFLQQNNVQPVIRKERYYFCQKSSDEIINLFKNKTSHCHFFFNHDILNLQKKDDIFSLTTSQQTLQAKNVVVATGGKSFALLGASDIGLKLAQNFHIQTKEFTPALVGLTLQKEQFWMKELSGLSCYVHITVEDKILKEDLLFAHKGISGPVVLSASLYWKKGNISIDFLPNHNIEQLTTNTKKLISSALPLPKRLSKQLLKVLNIKDKECHKLSPQEKVQLKQLHHYTFAPAGNFGFSKAEVSRGGVKTSELNPYTLESLQIKNLYFIGEVVDVTGELGGYNFQWAFSSGVVCARDINSKKVEP